MILTSEETRALDARAADLGVPGLVLMENACRGAAAWIGDIAAAGPLVVLCGPGNNGGDGLGIARYLHNFGRQVEVLLGRDELSSDAAAQRRWCEHIGIRVGALGDTANLAARVERLDRPWVVDALFGTGLNRPLEAPWSDWVEALGRWRGEGLLRGVAAVDLPSGLNADLAAPIGPHVVADATITFAAEKPACVLSPNAEACGRVEVVDLGFAPETLLERPAIERIREAEVGRLLPVRPAGGHKGTFGHLLVIGGSRGMDGAPALSAGAALRSGAGMVSVAAPAPTAGVVGLQVREALTRPLADDDGGSLAIDALDQVIETLDRYDAVVLGPGLGAASVAREVGRRLALAIDLPLVLDADGLNAFAGRFEELRRRSAPTVLTPHPGELSRLLEVDREAIVGDPIAAARRAADLCGQIVVLKAAATVIAEEGEVIAVVREATSGMATAGSGDVLTGVLGALLAAGVPAAEAARIGVWVHATCGSIVAAERSDAGMVAGDLIDSLSRIWARFEGR